MNIFVFEHVSGGGVVECLPDPDLAAQGAAMLTAILSDMVGAGLTVSTTRDRRIERVAVGARVVTVGRDDPCDRVFEDEARCADAVLVIAPETDGTLARWCCVLRDAGVRSLGCSPEAVHLCADKLRLFRRLRQAGVPTPTTWRATDAAAQERANESIGCVVEKPLDGAGCERITLHRKGGGLLVGDSAMIRQCHVPGVPVSVSFLVHDGVVRALPAGRQVIQRRGNDLTYRGGRLPLEPADSQRATALARRAVGAVAGLQGFVGVDLVLADEPDGDRVIEINPRLTVSYIGLRALCRTNLAAAIVDHEAPLRFVARPVGFDAIGRIL